MNSIHLSSIAVIVFSFVSFLFADEIKLRPVQREINGIDLTCLGDGEWEIKTTGTDPYFYVEIDGEVDLDQTPILSFESFSTTGVGRLLVFVGNVLDIPRLIEYHSIARTEGWAKHGIDISATLQPPPKPVKQLRITMGGSPGLVVRIRHLTLRSPLPHEKEEKENRERQTREDIELTDKLNEYLQQKYPSKITSVKAAQSGTITIEGEIKDHFSNDLFLVEVPFWKDYTQFTGDEKFHPIPKPQNIHAQKFTVTFPRFDEQKQDRLLVGWGLVRQENSQWKRLSALHYVDSIEPRAKLSAVKPRNLKGIGGCPMDHPDMQELGIASVTFNLILNEFLFAEIAPNRIPYKYADQTWYADMNNVARYDTMLKTAFENGWMVSAIVLIPPGRYAPDNSWHQIVSHPDADFGGAFVMPNFTTQKGTEAFAAAINFVAERYSRPDGEFGRIHHWIMHNEINNAFYWTTAGRKSVTTYMDLYQKSMRLTQALARQYDLNAKTLISLDHCWNIKTDPRGYTGKELLEYLVRFSRQEGNFEWGIAFHPYPQDIRNPRTWEDSQATSSTDTLFLTYKNLEVLDAWVSQPNNMFEGRLREIQFTEQGLNSPDYSEKTLRDQAAAMVFVWKKLKSMKSVTAFQYHLWADSHDEGGLRLGLRKFADDPDNPFGKKPIWYLYKALETSDEEKASEFALPIIGNSN